MKTVILALVVLLLVSQGEGLRCYCGGQSQCADSTEICTGSDEVCAIIVSQHDYSYFQRCLDRDDCRRLVQSSDAFGVCCTTDLCN